MRRNHLAWAAALIAALAAPHAFAANVTLSVSSAEVSAGAEFPVEIDVAANPGIGAMHIEMTYDPAVLAAQSVEKGAVLQEASMETNLQKAGRVILSVMSGQSIKGDGPLANVKFKVVGDSGAGSPLVLENCKVWSDQESGLQLSVTVAPGQTKVASRTPWIKVGGGGAVALVVILLGVALTRKPRAAPATRALSAACAKCSTPFQGEAQFCQKCGAARS